MELSRLHCNVIKEVDWFDRRIRWKCGNGSKIRFWEDWWVGDGSLADKFPILYSMSSAKHKAIKNLGVWTRIGPLDGFIWHIPWRRQLFE